MELKRKKQRKFLDMKVNLGQHNVVEFRAEMKKGVSGSVLFSKGKLVNNFFTEDSKLYITPKEQALLRSGIELNRAPHKWDNISSRIVTKFVRYNPSATSLLLKSLEKRYEIFNDVTSEASRTILGQFSTAKLWNASIVGSILFGMVMMTFVYRYLGQGASAKQLDPVVDAVEQRISIAQPAVTAADTNNDAALFAKQVKQLEDARSAVSLEGEILDIVKGHPMEKMAPFIAKQDRTVAAFIVAIGNKESGYGEHVPVLNGKDCYNYWGYRGIRDRMGTGGHTCFDSPEDAVNTVAKRITTLVEEKGKDTPEKMVLWKCGNSCAATGGQAAANKWISDVRGVFDEFDKSK